MPIRLPANGLTWESLRTSRRTATLCYNGGMSESNQRPAGTKRNIRMPLIILLAAVILLTAAVMVFFRAPSEKGKTITYSMYPYLPDTAYCAEVLEEEWAKVHPDVKLEYVPYNCYHDGKPEGVDVVMYDSMLERMFMDETF